MKTIYKYPIEITDEQTIDLPYKAIVIDFAEQNGDFFIWCLVDTGISIERRTFRIYGTGHPINWNTRYKLNHIKTLHTDNLVWHLFEEVI